MHGLRCLGARWHIITAYFHYRANNVRIGQKQSRRNSKKTSREGEMYKETDHKLESTRACHRGTQGVCVLRAIHKLARHTPPNPSRCRLLGLPADKSSSWAGEHLNLNRRTPEQLLYALLSVSPRSALPPPWPHPRRQRQRGKQNLELTQKRKLSTHKSHINPIEFLSMIDSTESAN